MAGGKLNEAQKQLWGALRQATTLAAARRLTASRYPEDGKGNCRVTSDPPPRSPFEPGYVPPGLGPESADEPGSPFAAGYEPSQYPEPRLGILHLIGATTCVAIHLGLTRTAELLVAHLATGEKSPVFQASGLMHSIGCGLAMGGLLLWLARRLRAAPFPRHPGEYLLLVQGIMAVLGLGVHFSFSLIELLSEGDGLYAFWGGIFFAYYLTGAMIYLMAARRVGVRRWRRFFFLCAGTGVLAGLLACIVWYRFGAAHQALYVLVSVVLVVIVIRDHREGFRYPWTHWLGVGVRMWFTLLSVAWFVLMSFFWEMLSGAS